MRIPLYLPYKQLKFSYLFVIVMSFTISQSILAATDPTIQSPSYPYPNIPLHLQGTTTVVKGTVRPNVMLFIDNSGSMNFDSETKNNNNRYKTRLEVTQEVLTDLVDTYRTKNDDGTYTSQIWWGLQTLHNQNNRPVSDYKFRDNSKEVKDFIKGIRANGGTPTTRRYYEIQKNMRDNGIQFRCQKNLIVLMSDGDANLSCQTGRIRDTWHFGDLNDAFFGGYISKGTCQKKSGGDISTTWDVEQGLQILSHPLASKDVINGGTKRDKDGKSFDEDDYPKQTIETFTIGFGDGISKSGTKYLEEGATTNSIGQYISANSQEELKNAIKYAIDEATDPKDSQGSIEVQTFSSTAPVVPSVLGEDRTGAAIRLDTTTWSSEIRFYNQLADKKSFDMKNWKTPSFDNRKLMVNYDGDAKEGQVRWAKDALNDPYFGLPGEKAEESQAALMPWFARLQDDTQRPRYATFDYRERKDVDENGKKVSTRNMGDVINSSLVTFGGENASTKLQEYLITSSSEGMLYLFKSQANIDHPYDLKLNYMPIAMQRERTDDTDNLAKYLKNIANERYGAKDETDSKGNIIKKGIPHIVLMDAGISVRQSPKQKALNDKQTQYQQAFLVSSMGIGGRGVFALNVGGKEVNTGRVVGIDANQDDWLTTVPLFETPKGEANHLGYTIGVPQIGRLSMSKALADGPVYYATFFGNGYDHPTKKENALYVYNILNQDVGLNPNPTEGRNSGELLAKIVLKEGHSLATPTIVDIDNDGLVDIAYAGDYEGNMWRFDFRDNNWKASKLFTTENNRPITAAPAVSKVGIDQYVVVFGTGSSIYQKDLENKDTNAVYGIFDNLSTDDEQIPGNKQIEVKLTDLVERKFLEKDVDIEQEDGRIEKQTFRTVDALGDEEQAFKNKKGWYIRLGGNSQYEGERVVVKPQMMGRTAVFTTDIYDLKQGDPLKFDQNKETCDITKSTTTSTAKSWIMNLNVETGSLSYENTRIKFIGNESDFVGVPPVGQLQSTLSFTNLVLGTGLGTSQDGDHADTKEDTHLLTNAENKNIVGSDCIPKEAFGIALTDSELKELVLEGKVCPFGGAVKRISWKEIF